MSNHCASIGEKGLTTKSSELRGGKEDRAVNLVNEDNSAVGRLKFRNLSLEKCFSLPPGAKSSEKSYLKRRLVVHVGVLLGSQPKLFPFTLFAW